MDPEARRRACVELRVELSRDTGTNLTADTCNELLDTAFKFEGRKYRDINLQSKPGFFYRHLGEAITCLVPPFAVPNHLTIAWWFYREAAEVHADAGGMCELAYCYENGQGVKQDYLQAAACFQKAADLGDLAAKCQLGSFLVNGSPRFPKYAARGLELLHEAAEQGNDHALHEVAVCYLNGIFVERDAVHGVSLFRQVITQAGRATPGAQVDLAICYQNGYGVEVDLKKAAKLSCRAAAGGNAKAKTLLEVFIRTCDFCGTANAAKLWCKRCRKVRYCDSTCQRAHWYCKTDPHKAKCHRVTEASQEKKSCADGTPGRSFMARDFPSPGRIRVYMTPNAAASANAGLPPGYAYDL